MYLNWYLYLYQLGLTWPMAMSKVAWVCPRPDGTCTQLILLQTTMMIMITTMMMTIVTCRILCWRPSHRRVDQKPPSPASGLSHIAPEILVKMYQHVYLTKCKNFYQVFLRFNLKHWQNGKTSRNLRIWEFFFFNRSLYHFTCKSLIWAILAGWAICHGSATLEDRDGAENIRLVKENIFGNTK